MNVREEFISHYMVHLRGALPRALCDEWVRAFFARTGVDESDPGTFPEDRRRFSGKTRSLPVAEASPMTWDAICEILGGEGMIDQRTHEFSDNFNLNFDSGADQPWRGPGPDSPGWHKDGWFFRHFLDSPEQALLCLVIWRDIGPRSGGTFYAPDSVPLICREMLDHPEGLKHNHHWGRLIRQCRDFREVTAAAGDVIILHPYMLHAASQNPSGRIRFMNNKVVSLKEPMVFARPAGDYTPLEASILRALGVESLDFAITGERKRNEDFSRMVEDEEEVAAGG